jgi:hypothetical protein
MEQNNIGLRGINAADRDNYIWIEASDFSNWRSFIFVSIDLRYSFFYFASLFVYENRNVRRITHLGHGLQFNRIHLFLLFCTLQYADELIEHCTNRDKLIGPKNTSCRASID